MFDTSQKPHIMNKNYCWLAKQNNISDREKFVDMINQYEITIKFFVIKKFENLWSKYIGIKYSVGVTSCSAALHIALASNNFKKKKKVLVPAMTFTATAAAALYCDLEPIFVDINEYGGIYSKFYWN